MLQAAAFFLGNDKEIRTFIRFFVPFLVKDGFSVFRKFVCNTLYDLTFPGTGLSVLTRVYTQTFAKIIYFSSF